MIGHSTHKASDRFLKRLPTGMEKSHPYHMSTVVRTLHTSSAVPIATLTLILTLGMALPQPLHD